MSEILETTALVEVLSETRVKRRLQVWHCLIPLFVVFCVGFAIAVFMSSYLPFLVIGVLGVLALFSVLIIGLAWAFQNNV
jgi:CHASE2 domain-containing sensor protein